MKKLLFIISIAFLFSCDKHHKSELKQEKGIVLAKQFKGELNASGHGVGFTTGGEMTFTTVDIHESEKFDVVFKCEHGIIFTVNSSDIYAKVKENDSVIIDYYEILNQDNIIKDFDFYDATPIKN